MIVGWTGQLSLAQGTVVGIGAYVSAILTAEHGWPLLATFPCAAVACGLVGLALGGLALRFEGVFLAILTLSFALIVPTVLKYFDGLTGGTQGIVVPEAVLPGNQATGEYVVTLVCVAVAALATHNVVRDSLGLTFHAVRESPVAAEGSGIDVSRARIGAFVLGSTLAGLAGALYAATVGFISPDSFGLFYGIQFLTMVVVGGVRSIVGAFLGAWIVFELNTHVRPLDVSFTGAGIELSAQAVFSLVLIGVLITAPRGAAGAVSLLAHAVRPRIRPTAPMRAAPPSPTTEGVS